MSLRLTTTRHVPPLRRYTQLQQPTQLRKHRLMESLRVQQLFRDMEDEAAWIREKEPVAASTNRGTWQFPQSPAEPSAGPG